jgi:hypothetical protein
VGTGPVQKVEGVVRQIEGRPPQSSQELSASAPVSVIHPLVHAFRIVKNREQFHDFDPGPGRFREPPPRFEHTSPVRKAMKAVYWERIFFENPLYH